MTLARERQAAFKTRMRERGLRQVTLWLSDEQHARVKSLASGQGIDDLEARSRTLAEAERTLEARIRDLEKRESAARRPRPTVSNAVAPSHRERVARLVEHFTTTADWRTGARRQTAFSAEASDLATRMRTLARNTKTAQTIIGSLLQAYGQHGLLNEGETASLAQAALVLQSLGEAAGAANDRVNRSAKQVAAEEAAREKAAREAAHAVFPNLQTGVAILLLHHLGGHDLFHVTKLRKAHPGDDIDYDARKVAEEALSGVAYSIERALRAGKTAHEAAQEFAQAFDAARPALMERHGDLIRHVNACATAAKLSKANKH